MKKIIINSALALTAMLGLLPAQGRATTLFNFTGGSGGQVTGQSLTTGVTFSTFVFASTVGIYATGTTCAVSALESYSAGVLSFSVVGAGSLGSANCSNGSVNPFSNVTNANSPGGKFISITESLVTFGSNPAATALYTAATSITFSSNFLTDLGLPTNASLQLVSPTNSSISTNAAGAVISSSAGFAVNAVPEPSTLLLVGFGLAAVGFQGRRKLFPAASGK